MSKIQKINEIIRGQVEVFTSYPEEWVRFMMSPSSQNYKLRFDEKVMIYHEAPDANLVATLELWNKLNIGVKRGSRGIPVLAGEPGNDGKIKYYFSVKDTINRGQYNVFLWSAREDDRDAIMEALGYDSSSDISIEDAIRESVKESVLEETEGYIDQMSQMEEFRQLDSRMQDAMKEAFADLAVESSVLLVMNRIGIYPKDIDVSRFDRLKHFSAFPIFCNVAALVNEVSTSKIEVVKRAIKENRRKENGIRIPDAGRPAVPDRGIGRSEGGIRGVRNAETELSGAEQTGGVSEHDGGRGAGTALPGGGQTGGRTGTDSDQKDDESEEDRREPESGESDKVDSGGERSQGGGERDRENADDIQIREADSIGAAASLISSGKPGEVQEEKEEQKDPRAGYRYFLNEGDVVYLNGKKYIFIECKDTTVCVQDEKYPLFKTIMAVDTFMAKVRSDPLNDHLIIRSIESPEKENVKKLNEDEQPSDIGKKDPFAGMPDTGSRDNPDKEKELSDDAINDILRTGGGKERTLYHISAKLQEDITEEEFTEFLKNEYGAGGKGFRIENRMISVWYDGGGIRFSVGENSARKSYDMIISWEDAARRIRTMYAEGNYVSDGIMSSALDTESEELASRIYFFYRDTRYGSQAPAEWNFGNYPETVEAIKRSLEDADAIREIYSRIGELYAKFVESGEAPRFVMERMPGTLHSIRQLLNTVPYVKQEENVSKPGLIFITQDEIDELLRNGSGVAGGKFRIYDCFTDENKRDDRIAFLKKEYGIGGRGGFAIPGCENSGENHDAKGIVITKGDLTEPEVELTVRWEKVEERIRQLVEAGEYLSEEEKVRHTGLSEMAGLPEEKEHETEETPADDEKNPFKMDFSDATEKTDEEDETSERIENPESEHEEPDSEETLKGSKVTIDRMDYEVTEDDGKECVLKNLADAELDGAEHLPRRMPIETVTDYIDGILSDEDVPVETGTQKIHNALPENEAVQYRITDDSLGTGGPKEKFRRNVEAIRVLKQCESEGRMATHEEQEILSRYVGWGGIAEAFDENKKEWSKEYEALKELLTEEEYSDARRSTLTAFYTPPVVIRSIYQALENMGLKSGNILEPSCGTGNFIGMQPEGISNGCNTYGVELDSISSRIAQQLYQKSRIQVSGYENASLPDDFFDVAVGNVPFGDFKVSDRRYNNRPWLIHDYFFGKTLDKVRPGGIIAFITSKGTMDKKNPAVRQYLAERADLLGAIRLPDTAFKANAGTTVTSDILFLRKKEHPTIGMEEDWVHLGTDPDGIEMNQYFIGHPEMVLGKMEMVSTAYGMDSTCREDPDETLASKLGKAVGNIGGTIEAYDPYEIEEELTGDANRPETIPADPDVKNFSYAIRDGKLYYREGSIMYAPAKTGTSLERIKEMIGIREAARKIINMQLDDWPDVEIRKAQRELNRIYDGFVEKYGRINSVGNRNAFSEDESYYLISSLEVLDEEGNFKEKAAIFSKRTISRHVPVTRTDTASEALTVCMSEKGKVDLPFISDLTGKSEEEIKEELAGSIFRDLSGDGTNYVTRDEYLTGNVREKLRDARAALERGEADAAINVEALEKAQPEELGPAEIKARLGSSWIPEEDIKDFICDLLDITYRWHMHVEHNRYSGEWKIGGKDYGDWVKKTVSFGTERKNAMEIIEDSLNLRTVKVMDYWEEDGKRKCAVNRKETEAAMAKQEAIMQEFREWLWKKPERRERLCREYNEKFNNSVNREYDGDFLNFAGINPEITLRKHQRDAVARIMLGGNSLIAHCVGAGKTMAMAAAAQEMKRLGLCRKSLFVVPNHLTEQWGAEYMALYPGANILVARKKDFEKRNRKRFLGRISTGDYDAVIIGHSQFEKIPMGAEYRKKILTEELNEIMEGITSSKDSLVHSWERSEKEGRRWTIKQLEKKRASIEAKLEKLNSEERKDDVVTFEELGIDRLFVDEAHYYKNVAAFTKMTNVAGISQTEAQKSSDMYLKCRYMSEVTGNKGVIFATGTFITNTMVEMYTMQKFLQYDDLKEKDILQFDNWASTFGETKTEYELKPEGTGYQIKTRFSRFFNIPELMQMFTKVADIKTDDMLKLPVPECERHIISVEASPIQKAMVQDLGERADKVRKRMVDSRDDNMLNITNDGRKLALDQRLIDPTLPGDPDGKVAVCARIIHEIWDRTKDERSAQMVFIDLSTPSKDKWNMYDELKGLLMELGIPEDEIAFVHDAKTEKQKDTLFRKVNEGQVRVILGSTPKMGAGTNAQKKLIALHHLDCPWRPADLQQQEGRILRQGNENKLVHIYNYVTKGTFDGYMYQLVEAKQRFISQVATSRSPARIVEDVDTVALNYAEIKACCADDPLIKEKMTLENTINKLRMLKSSYTSTKYALADKIRQGHPAKIEGTKRRIAGLKADIFTVAENTTQMEDGISPMVVSGETYTGAKEAGEAIREIRVYPGDTAPKQAGTFRGLKLYVERPVTGFSTGSRILRMQGELSYSIELSDKQTTHNVTRMNKLLDGMGDELKIAESNLRKYEQELEEMKIEAVKPFPQEEELREAERRLFEINDLMESRDSPVVPDGQAEDVEEQTKERKSRARCLA